MCSLDLSLIVPSSINSEWPRFLSFPFSSASGKQLVEPVSGKKTFENVFALCTLSVFYYCSLECIRMVCGRKVAQKRLARIERHSRPWSWTDHAVNDMLKPKTFFFNFNLIFTTPINICTDLRRVFHFFPTDMYPFYYRWNLPFGLMFQTNQHSWCWRVEWATEIVCSG